MLVVALAQVNTTVGDLEGNAALISEYARMARDGGADLVAFPELAICGYPPEDLLLKEHFLGDSALILERVASECTGIAAVIGCPVVDGGTRNAAAVIYDGEIAGYYYKCNLPNYGVFDEKRYFESGGADTVFELGETRFGISICEDLWTESGPPSNQAAGGAVLLLNISASPFHASKHRQRQMIMSELAVKTGTTVAYCNLVGGQDELVFDGHSVVAGPDGEMIARARAFQEDLLFFEVPLAGHPRSEGTQEAEGVIRLGPAFRDPGGDPVEPRTEPVPGILEEIYAALVLGVRDYFRKNGFERAVLGLSGGIDSSLTAAVACDALGPENVVGVGMPSRISSRGSVVDAERLSEKLEMEMLQIPIPSVYDSYLEALEPHFKGLSRNVAEENIQARIRGNLLMALSNKFGWLVLSTGNKSETSVGYATLYGDMAGGLAVIKDVPKTMVYKLSRYRNEVAGKEIIPESVLTKPPSAELSPNQKDTDSLPPYEVLDPILDLYVVDDASVEEIVKLGYDREMVEKVIRMVDRNEYKRRQGPPGIRITPRAFGKDRRMPITNRYPSGSSG